MMSMNSSTEYLRKHFENQCSFSNLILSRSLAKAAIAINNKQGAVEEQLSNT